MDIRSWSCSGKDVIRLGQRPAYPEAVFLAKRSWWRAAWKRLVGRTRMSERRSRSRKAHCYDAYTYAQNFEEGRAWDEEEPDNLSRSFSMRFADPSRLRFLNHQLGLLD